MATACVGVQAFSAMRSRRSLPCDALALNPSRSPACSAVKPSARWRRNARSDALISGGFIRTPSAGEPHFLTCFGALSWRTFVGRANPRPERPAETEWRSSAPMADQRRRTFSSMNRVTSTCFDKMNRAHRPPERLATIALFLLTHFFGTCKYFSRACPDCMYCIG